MPFSIIITGKVSINSHSRTLYLNKVLHAPTITKYLLSVQQFAKDNHVFFEFNDSHFFIKDKISWTTLLSGLRCDELYILQPQSQSSPTINLTTRTTKSGWHNRLGHPHHKVLQHLITRHNLSCLKSSLSVYNACPLGKACRRYLSLTSSQVIFLLNYYFVMYEDFLIICL